MSSEGILSTTGSTGSVKGEEGEMESSSIGVDTVSVGEENSKGVASSTAFG